MPKNKKYHPDYRALYPGVEISSEVLAALHKSDRKMEYMEWELKHSRVRKNKAGEIISATPPREASLENIEEGGYSVCTTPSLEEEFFRDEGAESRELHRCLALLTEDERALMHALYMDKLTEKKYGKRLGVTQQAISKRKNATLKKLRRLMKKF